MCIKRFPNQKLYVLQNLEGEFGRDSWRRLQRVTIGANSAQSVSPHQIIKVSAVNEQ